MSIRCVAFDCFGTVFRMDGVPREEIRRYVEHVNRDDFSPFLFADPWWRIFAHSDSRPGIAAIRKSGVVCVALSNGPPRLIAHLSKRDGIVWDCIVDLAKHRVYKPHRDAYLCVEKESGIPPAETLMVTANPTFGDIEGAASVGMPSQVIRQPGAPSDIAELAKQLRSVRRDDTRTNWRRGLRRD